MLLRSNERERSMTSKWHVSKSCVKVGEHANLPARLVAALIQGGDFPQDSPAPASGESLRNIISAISCSLYNAIPFAASLSEP